MNKQIDLSNTKIKKILICQLRQIGDVLLATPSIRLLAERFPEAELHFFTEKKCLPMLEGNPHLSKVWALDKNKLSSIFKQIYFYRQIAAENFDLIVDFQQLPRCKYLIAFCRAKIRLSFVPKWYNKPFYTHWHSEPEIYAAQAKAAALIPLGIKWNGEKPELFLSQAEQDEADTILNSAGIDFVHKTLITVDATHNRKTRCWPHYAKLMDLLAEQRPDIQFLLPYAPSEHQDVLDIKRQCEHKDHVFVTEKVLSLRQMAGCMHRASLHIGNCSSPRHIAVAMYLPSVTILGATGPTWKFPSAEHINIQKGLPCQPCNENTCNYNFRCLQELPAETVAQKVMEHLDKFGKK